MEPTAVAEAAVVGGVWRGVCCSFCCGSCGGGGLLRRRLLRRELLRRGLLRRRELRRRILRPRPEVVCVVVSATHLLLKAEAQKQCREAAGVKPRVVGDFTRRKKQTGETLNKEPVRRSDLCLTSARSCEDKRTFTRCQPKATDVQPNRTKVELVISRSTPRIKKTRIKRKRGKELTHQTQE